MAAVDGYDAESVKIMDNKGCSSFCTGLVRQGSSMVLCVANKRIVHVYEINRTKQRHRKIKEIPCPNNVQYIQVINERLLVGYQSFFAIYSLQGDGAPMGEWLNPYAAGA